MRSGHVSETPHAYNVMILQKILDLYEKIKESDRLIEALKECLQGRPDVVNSPVVFNLLEKVRDREKLFDKLQRAVMAKLELPIIKCKMPVIQQIQYYVEHGEIYDPRKRRRSVAGTRSGRY